MRYGRMSQQPEIRLTQGQPTNGGPRVVAQTPATGSLPSRAGRALANGARRGIPPLDSVSNSRLVDPRVRYSDVLAAVAVTLFYKPATRLQETAHRLLPINIMRTWMISASAAGQVCM